MKQHWNEWKRRWQQFMIGRYGVDQFARFLNVCIILLLAVNLFLRTHILYWMAVVLLVYSYYRMFSKHISARFQENEWYLRLRFRMEEKAKRWDYQIRQMIKYHIYRCPGCGQKIRIPRGKGRISIHCPKCHKDFTKRS